jgi:hypothetical protein
MAVMGISKFERFFRSEAGLHVDKSDLKRYNGFIQQKIYDLLIMAQATARANDRGLIMPFDLPITQGLQQSIHRFEKLDIAIELDPILEHLATLPALDLLVDEETQAQLPVVAGGLSLALADAFKVIDPKSDHPASLLWERGFQIFHLLL